MGCRIMKGVTEQCMARLCLTLARLLNQIYVVPVLQPGYDYDNLHANVIDEPTPGTSTGATTSAHALVM